jgi:hypothetical protein
MILSTKTTEKKIPNLKIPIANVLLEDTFTKDKYLSSLEKFERECENYLLDLFKKLNLSSTVKRDRYSLPFQNEITFTLEGSSYLNSAFHFPAVAKGITKHVLNLDSDHIRFYLFINLGENGDLGSMDYSFRYSLKNPSR